MKSSTGARQSLYVQFGSERLVSVNLSICELYRCTECIYSGQPTDTESRELEENEELSLRVEIREGMGPLAKKISEVLIVSSADIKETLAQPESESALFHHELMFLSIYVGVHLVETVHLGPVRLYFSVGDKAVSPIYYLIRPELMSTTS